LKANPIALSANLVYDLQSQITGGAYKVGSKLPSEAKLATQYNVSRTVVREAIASLRSIGLVKTRQGAGAFIARLSSEEPVLTFRPVNLQKISSIIEALEIRRAVEVEAAALAAERRSPMQIVCIFEALEAFRKDIESGQDSAATDFKFHLAVAEAANNSRFTEFLTIMDTDITPRRQLKDDFPGIPGAMWTKEYFQMLYSEHEAIANAINARDPIGARTSMTDHLSGKRYINILTTKKLYDK